MDDKRTRLVDRRRNKDRPRAPFRDDKGETIRECRRKNPDRRLGNIHMEWIRDFESW